MNSVRTMNENICCILLLLITKIDVGNVTLCFEPNYFDRKILKNHSDSFESHRETLLYFIMRISSVFCYNVGKSVPGLTHVSSHRQPFDIFKDEIYL